MGTTMIKQKHIISVSGGKDSIATLIHALRRLSRDQITLDALFIPIHSPDDDA